MEAVNVAVNVNVIAPPAIISATTAGPTLEPHHQLLSILSRPRATETTSRVSSAVQLVEALRRVEGLGINGNQSQPMHLFVALALRELDHLIDRMTYEELLQAFGGKIPLRRPSETSCRLASSALKQIWPCVLGSLI